ncbi:MAG: hypothetical protein KC621_29950, partial [Myxococcales bacterium]|nr:hypothetical protein [Myxococcales bacterium]
MFWCASALAGAVQADPEHARASLGAGIGAWTEVRPSDLVPAPAAMVRGGVALADPLWIELEGDAALPPGGFAWAPRIQLGVVAPLPTLRPELLAGVGIQGASSRDPAVAAEPSLLAHWGLALGVPLAGGPYV